MFRKIRRTKNEISQEEARQLLVNERRGVLSVQGDDGYPYGVPINYLYSEADGKIYFHGAKAGHKIDSIRRCDKVCFTVFGNEKQGDPEWAPYMQSVVIFGRCRLIEDQAAAISLVKRFASKYYPDQKLVDEEAEASGKAVQMFEIEIEHMSGKQIQER